MKEAAFQKAVIKKIKADWKELQVIKVRQANVVGVPDLYIHGVGWVELKIGNAPVTDAQKRVGKKLDAVVLRLFENTRRTDSSLRIDSVDGRELCSLSWPVDGATLVRELVIAIAEAMSP